MNGSVRHRYASETEGLPQAAADPIVCFFGHHHTRLDTTITGVPCLGLDKVRMPGNLVAINIDPRRRVYDVLGEWPTRG